MSLTRRQAIRTAAGAALLGPALLRTAQAQDGAKKTVLFFTKSSGFQHSAIAREGDELSYAEKVMTKIGKDHNIEVVCSKDGRLFDPASIEKFDGFVFYTTGDLTQLGTDRQPPISADGLTAFFERVSSGKAGFVGVHSATDTFGKHRGMDCDDPYIQMIGGHFNGHGAQQEVELTVTDPKFPGAGDLPDPLKITDEWYSQKCQPAALHVILKHNTGTMTGGDYERPDYPQTWAKMYENGRVFYTSMGHREDVWDNPLYQGLLIGGLSWTLGLVEAEIPSNTLAVTPEFQKLQGQD